VINRLLRLAVLATLLSAPALSDVLYVDAQATGSADGSSWANAFTDLPAAIAAAGPGDEIWVAAGTYTPTATTDRTISFVMKDGVGIFGGFGGAETQRSERDPAAHVTILSGDIGAAGDTGDNSVHVVTVNASVRVSGVLDGFTITAGRTDGAGGGGMWIDGGAPTLSGLIFMENDGVGLRVDRGSPTVTSCQFVSNTGNGAAAIGGLTCRSCVFRSNNGDGVSVFFGSLTLVNSIIAENTADGASVGLGNVRLDSCTVAHNGGHGLWITSRTGVSLDNTIIWGNTLGGIYVRPLPEPLAESSTSISYCDVQGGVRSGPGNISADPLFLSPPGDLRPGVGSPVVDAGDNASVPPGVATDIDGLPRFMDDPSTPDTGLGTPPIVDMGAHERQAHLSVTAPGNLDLCAGENAVLSVSAFGLPPLAYQWRRDAVVLTNGGRIFGADTATLTISAAIPDDSGSYDVVVADGDGHSMDSPDAILAVNSAPRTPLITAPFSVAVESAGHIASVPAASGSSWSWTLSGGTITAGQDTNQITFDAGPPGTTMVLSVTDPSWSCPTSTASTAVSVDFLDVSPGDIFHDFVAAIARAGITAGCGLDNYCRDASITRAQMAVFLLKAKYGSAYTPPACTGAYLDVPCPSTFADWVEQLSAEGITAGCGADNYCPDDAVLRAQMAVFLLRSAHGPAYVPPACTGIFEDVPCPGNGYAAWIERLSAEGVTAGCSTIPSLYCPSGANTRGQMSVFLTKAFGLPLP